MITVLFDSLLPELKGPFFAILSSAATFAIFLSSFRKSLLELEAYVSDVE